MSWELVKGGKGFGTYTAVAEDEVSICVSKAGKSIIHRMNVLPSNFPGFNIEDPEGSKVRSIKLMIDQEKKRIGLFKIKPGEEFDGKKITTYGKTQKLVYISLPKIISTLGFTKGRYKIVKLKDNDDMYFMIKLEGKKEDGVKPTDKKE